jgi:osmoprotectant transport system ATP-binding protein
VRLTRGRAEVLSGIDLAIAPGETLAIVGRSGTGKSSLLKLINGLLRPDAGSVRVRGRETAAWNPYELRRQIGYVMQEVGLFPHLSIRDNVGVVPRLLGWAPERIADRVAALLDLVGLAPALFADRRPHELSGGQRQRVGVARGLAADPPILLMDEPFGALDPITRSEIHHEFTGIQERLRKTIVLVTHDMAEALALGTRVGVMEQGVLAAVGAPPAIAASDDPRVRDLLQPLREASAVLGRA